MTQVGRPLLALYVLVVDDHGGARESLRLMLAYSGASVTVASSAPAALDALERLRADVVVADIVLGSPEDGVWLLRRARTRWPRLPFVGISGEDVDGPTLVRMGFEVYLRKPAGYESLVSAVLSAIARPI